jgi:hypothetical protein
MDRRAVPGRIIVRNFKVKLTDTLSSGTSINLRRISGRRSSHSLRAQYGSLWASQNHHLSIVFDRDTVGASGDVDVHRTQ